MGAILTKIDSNVEFVNESECPGCQGKQFAPLQEREFLSLCDDCGLVFDNPRPTVEAIAAYYNKKTQYDPWLQNLEARDRLWRRRLHKMRYYRRAGTLLDIGTGIGQFLNLARTQYSAVMGTEISSSAIEIAQRLYHIDILNGAIESLDFDQRFDNLTAFHVLEHVHQPTAFLRRCHELLRTGGQILLAVPNDLESLAARLGKHTLVPIRLSDAEIHLSHFTTKSLAHILSYCRFRVMHMSLDPFWVVAPSREYLQYARYMGMGALHRLTGLNFYPTIWVAAQKS